jgi:hypothetical protein
VAVVVGQSKVMRVRPLLKNWSCSFEVSILEEMANTSTLQTWLRNGGSFVGLCDWRPRHGRYEVVSVELVKSR